MRLFLTQDYNLSQAQHGLEALLFILLLISTLLIA